MSPEDVKQQRTLREYIGIEGPRIKYATNADTTTRAGKILAMSLTDTATLETDSVVGKQIAVTHYLVHSCQLVGNGGEIVDAPRIVLRLSDGNTVAFVSDGILDSLQMLLGIVGPGPWDDEPLLLLVKANKTRRGFRVYKLALEG